ncbi:MAG: glutathione S-transferase N-terminal domain-containing protein [Chromatiales bacterium]|jgi:glutaredoxin
MKYLFLPLHFIIGGLIRLVDFATSPTPLQRPADEQQQIAEDCKNLTLFHYPACPFCVRVRRNMKRLNLPIRRIDPRKDAQAMQRLTEEGGKQQVPCLQIIDANGQSSWLYESGDINAYLNQRFAGEAAPQSN